MWNSVEFNQAFAQLTGLNESDFNITRDGVDELEDVFNDDSLENQITVYDIDAEDADDVADSYSGQILLACENCGELIARKPEDINIAEDAAEGAHVDIDDCYCPVCHSEFGYVIKGKIVPYEEVEVEITEKDEADEDAKDDVPEDEAAEEDADVTDDEDAKDDSNVTEEFLEDLNTKNDDAAANDVVEKVNKYVKGDDKQAHIDAAKAAWAKGEIDRSEYMTYMKRLDDVAATNKLESCCDKEEEYICSNKDDEMNECGETVKEAVVFDADDKAIDKMNAIIADSVESLSEDEETNEVEQMNEGLNDIQLDTDNEHISIHSEAKNNGDEMAAPLDFTAANEIADAQTDDSEDEFLADVDAAEEQEPESEPELEQEPAEDEENAVDIQEFDNESFDQLGESFLKQVYSNVKSYKTESVSDNGNALVCEGLIEFDSGKRGKTQFVVEGDSLLQDGNCTLLVENAQITPGKKAIKLSGKFDNGKLISESLDYEFDDFKGSVRI